MGEQYVSFKTANMLKEAGFDEYCRLSRDVCGGTCVMEGRNNDLPPEYISCPTQALAARWLREVHELHVSSNIYRNCSTVYSGKYIKEWTFWNYTIYSTHIGGKATTGDKEYKTYEEAMEAGLQKAIKLIKR